MPNVEQRAWGVAGRATGNSVAAGVTALATMIGLGGVEATIVGAVGGSLAEESVAVVASLRERRLRNLERFGGATSKAAAKELNELLREASGDPSTLELLAQAAEAAARSFDDWKIDLLARVFVDGLRNQDSIDVAAVVLDVVKQLEVLHLHVLDRLPGPIYDPRDGRSVDAAVPVSGLEQPSAATSRSGPDLSEVIHMVVGKLVALGLAVKVDKGTWDTIGTPMYMITRLGNRVRLLLRERGTDLLQDGNSQSADA